MNNRRIGILVAVLSAAIIGNTFAWVRNITFESHAVGERAGGSDALSSAYSNSYISDEQAQTGKQSCKMGIAAGETGFGKWGGVVYLPTTVKQGEELWFRCHIFFPGDFNYSAGGVGLKTMRVHTKSPTQNSEGYLDMLVSGDLTVGSEITSDYFTNNPNWKDCGGTVPKGVWQYYEMYAKFHSEPGKAVYRVWQNGKLINEDTKTKTLRTAASFSDFAYIFTYWNDGSPKTQSCYVDNVVATNQTPPNRDAAGNPMIGADATIAHPAESAPPIADGFVPKSGAADVSPSVAIILRLKDAGSGVDSNTISMKVNGATVSPFVSGEMWDLRVLYKQPGGFSAGEEVSVSVNAKDLQGNLMKTIAYSFTVAGQASITRRGSSAFQDMGLAIGNAGPGTVSFHFPSPTTGTYQLRAYNAAGACVRNWSRVLPGGSRQEVIWQNAPSGILVVTLSSAANTISRRTLATH